MRYVLGCMRVNLCLHVRYDADLDEMRDLRSNGRSLVRELQQRYRMETGVSNLKIKDTNILGMFVEVPVAHSTKLLESGGTEFMHCQTLKSSMRFKTKVLSGFVEWYLKEAHSSQPCRS